MPRAAPTLARISGAPSLSAVTRWVGYELQFEFCEPFRPEANEAEEWDTQWNRLYLNWLESQYRSHPEVTLFGNGLLRNLLQGEG